MDAPQHSTTAQQVEHYVADPSAWQEGDHCDWTNDPELVCGTTYFSNNVPNTGSHYGIEGLGPILRRTQGGSEWEFLCKDSYGNYYITDVSNNYLMAYKGSWEMEEWEVISALFSGDLYREENLVHFLDKDFYEQRVVKQRLLKAGS